MGKITSFIKLDFMSIKPYVTFKNILIYLMIALITSYGNESNTSAIIMLVIFTMLYATYPFAVGDQNGLDSLYTILGISKKEVIKGRYAFLLVMNVIGMILGLAVYFLLSLIFQTPIDSRQALIVSVSSIMMFSLNQFILYPIFFKNGYIKSKSLSFLPLMLFGLIAVLGAHFFKGEMPSFVNQIITFITHNPFLTSLGVLVIWMVVLLISYRASYTYYIRREF